MEGATQLVGRAEFKGEGEELNWNVLIVFVCCFAGCDCAAETKDIAAVEVTC